MRAIRDPAATSAVADADLAVYLAERFAGMVEPGEIFDPDTHGWILIIDAGDDPNAAANQFDCFPLLTSPTGNSHYGEPGFTSPFAWVVDHGRFYAAVIVGSDGGDFVEVIVPKIDGVDPRLLAYCAVHAGQEAVEL